MNTPRNSRIKRLAGMTGSMSNYSGVGYGSTLAGNIGANNTNFNAASSNFGGRRANMSGAGVQGATADPALAPIKIQLTNTYSELLYYPMWNASKQFQTPYNGVQDYVTKLTPGADEGIIATFLTAPEASLQASLLASPILIQRMIYNTGTVTEQLEDTWYQYMQTRSGAYTYGPYFPGDEQNLLQQIQNKVQVNGLVEVIDWSRTWFIPVEPDNIVTITFYQGSQVDPTMILRGQVPVVTNAIPNVLGGGLMS